MRNLFERFMFRLMLKRNLKLRDEFIGTFPDKCMICSYHRYGFTHGYIGLNEPVPPHECIENKPKAGEE